MSKLGQEPAFPAENLGQYSYSGMSKRFYAACAAMQGILASQVGNYEVEGGTRQDYCEQLIEQSFQFADELLKQENAE